MLLSKLKSFTKSLDLPNLVVTKLDGSSKGGALIAIYRTMKLPIYFVGLGEDKDDLQPFSIDFYLDSILPETKEIATA